MLDNKGYTRIIGAFPYVYLRFIYDGVVNLSVTNHRTFVPCGRFLFWWRVREKADNHMFVPCVRYLFGGEADEKHMIAGQLHAAGYLTNIDLE